MTVRPLIFLPSDLAGSKIGGIQSFVQGFVKFAPSDFRVECVGTSSDSSQRPVGQWLEIDVATRSVQYLPVLRTQPGETRSRIPVALAYTAALVRYRRRFTTTGRVLNFHRIGAPLVLRTSSAPKVQFVHLNVADIYQEQGESRWRLFPGGYHRVEDLTLRGMSQVYVVNQRGVEFYRRRHPALAESVRFLPTWFDPMIFKCLGEAERTASRHRMRAMLNASADARLVLYVGRLEAQKDPELLLASFARARQQDERLHLAIAGSGTLEPLVRRLASHSGIGHVVHLLGALPRERVAEWMEAADLLLLSSRFEGMPITVVEALATGLPAVAPAVGEVPRLVESGTTGWLVTERSPEALADGIHRVLGLPTERLRDNAVRRASLYRADTVLAPVYDQQRRLSDRASERRPSVSAPVT